MGLHHNSNLHIRAFMSASQVIPGLEMSESSSYLQLLHLPCSTTSPFIVLHDRNRTWKGPGDNIGNSGNRRFASASASHLSRLSLYFTQLLNIQYLVLLNSNICWWKIKWIKLHSSYGAGNISSLLLQPFTQSAAESAQTQNVTSV